MDTFIEETIFSDKGSEDGGVNNAGVVRRDEEAEEVRAFSLETKLGQMKKLAQLERGGQIEDNQIYPYEERRVQGMSADGAAVSVQEKVNAIHTLIHNSFSELASCVQRLRPSSSKPVLSMGLLPKAHVTNSCGLGCERQGAKVGTEEGGITPRRGKTSTQPLEGSEKMTEASVNFFRGVNADLIDRALCPVRSFHECADKGGPSIYLQHNHIGLPGESSSVDSSTPEKREELDDKVNSRAEA